MCAKTSATLSRGVFRKIIFSKFSFFVARKYFAAHDGDQVYSSLFLTKEFPSPRQ